MDTTHASNLGHENSILERWFFTFIAALMYSWLLAFQFQDYFASAGDLKLHVASGKFFFVLEVCIAVSSAYFSLFWPGEGFGRNSIVWGVA